MDEVFKDPVQLTKGINLSDLLSNKETEFQIDLDFKKKSCGMMLNADDDLFPDLGDEDDSDAEDVLKNIEESTDKMMLSSPEYHSFEELSTKMVDCVPSGDVKILIIEEGDGPLVPIDAEVTIHYAAYWEKAKIPFDSTLTMNCGAPQKVRLGVGKILEGLEIGLTTVRGPTARFQLLLQPRVAWGDKGAPPRIRPEPVLFVILLYSVGYDAQLGARFNDLPSEEQSKFETTLKTVTAIHGQAKQYFSKKKYIKAIKNYQQSTSVLKLSKPQNESEENELKKLKLNAYLNLAVCYYKIQKPKYVIYMLNSLENYNIIDTDNHCKSLFYYGRAYEALGKTEKATEYYKRALKLEPKNKDIGKALASIDGYIKQSVKKEKEMWQTVFKSEKKESVAVDEDFQNGVRELFKDLAGSDEYAKFDLPTGLNRNEVDYVKDLAKDFERLIVMEDGEGKRKKVTIVKSFCYVYCTTGDGPLVPIDAEVTIHYAAYWEKAKIPFDSTLTMNCGAPQKVRLGVGKILEGLEIGLTTVRGPTARFQLLLQPRVAWGDKGAPPRIRPEPVLFVILLYSVGYDAQLGARFNDLPSEEQSKFETTLKTVTAIHGQAKQYFSKKKYIKAIKNYQQSTSVLKLSKPQNESEENELKKLKLNAYLNLAVCYYKIQKPKYVIYMLNSLENYNIIDTDNHCKSLFYYGRAYEALGKTEKATEYYKRALKLEPKNKDIGKALASIDGYIKQSVKKEKEMWQTVFKSEKKESVAVDEDFQNGVRELFKDLAGSDEYAKFDLPTGLNRNEVDYVKDLAKDFERLIVMEDRDREGKRKKVTIVKRLM